MAVAILSFPLAAVGEMKHGDMSGMKMEGHGKMGDKIYGGKIGPWQADARLTDMKAHMEKAKSSGMKMEGMTNKTHHIALSLTDPKTKKPVAEGKGSLTVVGPDNSSESVDFMVMEGHFGADVNLSKKGKYTFKPQIESGGAKGTASFGYTVK
jgi:hypothetical protein